jgi:uncharacterized Zn finger protein
MKIETPILKRLGPVPFWRGENRCLDSLETMYHKAKNKAELALSNGLTTKENPPRKLSSRRK